MKIIGNKILLRTVLPSDIDLLFHWENDPKTQIHNIDKRSYTRNEIATFIESDHDIYKEKQLRLMIVLEATGEVIGTLDLFDYNHNDAVVGVGILIFETKNRGLGYASQSMNLLFRYASKHLSIKKIFCNISPNNSKSIRFFKSRGFVEQTEAFRSEYKDIWIKGNLFFLLGLT